MSASLLREFLLQFLDGHFVSERGTPTYLRVSVASTSDAEGCPPNPTSPQIENRARWSSRH